MTRLENKTMSASLRTLSLPRIGEVFSGQGGIYAGIMRGENGSPDYALIVPTDPRAVLRGAWGEYGKRVVGADNLRDGMANTIAMAEAGSELARQILALEIDGHKDLYLMSRHEARLCYLQVPELFEDGYYWTSTQYSPTTAWGQDFDAGLQGYNGKSNEVLAPAVRRLFI
jgi:hypothetical protein